jgi:putative heme transporter
VAMWAVVVLALVGGLYVGLPRIAGLDETWGRLSRGDPWWLAAAALLEAGSYAGYVVLFRGIFVGPGSPLGWRASYQITMAGVAATRIFAAAGAGGIALTAWALSHSGMGRRELVRGLTTFYVALYSVYMVTLVVCGVGLRSGLLSGPAPFGMTVVPAAFGGFVIAGGLVTALLPRDLDGRVRRRLDGHTRLAGWASALAAAAAAVAEGVRGAIGLLRSRNPALLGAVAWWGFDIAVLWACFHAFGEPPPTAVVVMAYFVGTLGNLLPLPGGVGGVEGGMIAAFLAFDVTGGLAVVAVLTYRAFSFWLPTVPGLLAYLGLRHTVKDWQSSPTPAGP